MPPERKEITTFKRVSPINPSLDTLAIGFRNRSRVDHAANLRAIGSIKPIDSARGIC
jgi:hypothetical protein